MPQFDIFSFFSQLWWLILSFSCLYLSFSYYLLPSIAIILKIRKNIISNKNEEQSDIMPMNLTSNFDITLSSVFTMKNSMEMSKPKLLNWLSKENNNQISSLTFLKYFSLKKLSNSKNNILYTLLK